MARNVQKFSSGEMRVFNTSGEEQILIAHVRAEGDGDKTDHTGKTIEEMDRVPAYERVFANEQGE
jgi:hypothetical protein